MTGGCWSGRSASEPAAPRSSTSVSNGSYKASVTAGSAKLRGCSGGAGWHAALARTRINPADCINFGYFKTSGLATRDRRPQSLIMFNVLSIIVGFFALLLAIPSFLPFFGWGNWVVIPIAIVGLIFGVFSSHTSGRNFNIVVILIGVGRLMLGGGIF